MNTNPALNRIVDQRTSYTRTAPTRDVTSSIKSWGRRGIYWGAIFGFTLGLILVAIPLSTNVLTFGVFGTLIVAAVECAVIAGAFAAFAAALFSQGGRTQAKPTSNIERQTANDGGRQGNTPLAEWTDGWSYPTLTTTPPVSPVSDGDWSTASSLQNRLDTIDAWENGNTGP